MAYFSYIRHGLDNEYLPQRLSNQNTMHPVSYNVLMPFAYTGTGAAPAVLKKTMPQAWTDSTHT